MSLFFFLIQILISQRDKRPKWRKYRCGRRLFIRRAGVYLPPKTKQISVFIKVCRERLSLKYKLFISSQPRRALKLKGFRREINPRPTEWHCADPYRICDVASPINCNLSDFATCFRCKINRLVRLRLVFSFFKKGGYFFGVGSGNSFYRGYIIRACA